MEGEEINSSGSNPPSEEEELILVGSPEDLGFQEVSFLSTTSELPSSDSVVLTDDLRDKIIHQVEYYFSDENLRTDTFLMKYVKMDKEGFVPITIIASFRKMKKLVQDNALIVAALKASSQLVVSSDGKKVKRIHPILFAEVKDAKLRTVLVENLPDNYSMENIQKIFGDAGNIKNICIRDPHTIEESTKGSKLKKVISGKIHALVEYDTVQAAEKAVATLNDEKNWRSGMRVMRLSKRMGTYGVTKKGRKGSVSAKNDHTPASYAMEDDQHKSINHHIETPEQEVGGHSPTEKIGPKGRRRGRPGGQKQHSSNEHGHGTKSSTLGGEVSKPPPGPRMPDGTRGFAMGRGRPIFNQN